MTVKELIEELKTYNKDLEVRIDSGTWGCSVEVDEVLCEDEIVKIYARIYGT